VTEVDKHGKSVERRLCAECARSRGITAQGAAKVAVAEVLLELKNKIKDVDRKLVCPNCRLTYADFQATTRLGCPECYNAFIERLLPVIKRIHGAVKHTGRAPAADRGTATRSFEVQRLRRELSAAIEAENYEQAAAVRDRIRKAGGEEAQ
jgi:protein arginine kinase activator